MQDVVMKIRLCRGTVAGLFLLGGVVLAGCGESSPSMADRQDRALKDPWHYGPDSEKPDTIGGGLGDFNAGAMGKDLDHVLNP